LNSQISNSEYCINLFTTILLININVSIHLFVGKGLQKNDLNFVISVGELSRQSIPCSNQSLQRQILCLTNKGLHVLYKIRPIDYLYRFLSQDNFNENYCVKDFFALYGTIECSVMCLSIACGLPADAGGGRHLNKNIIVKDPALGVVQSRAISAMLSNAVTDPSFRTVIASTMGGVNTLLGRAMDARLVNNPIASDLHLTYSPVHDAFHLMTSRSVSFIISLLTLLLMPLAGLLFCVGLDL
jgi:hypothetical protein